MNRHRLTRLTAWRQHITGWLRIRRWLDRQEGQDLTEYGLLVALAVLICIAAVRFMGGQIASLWKRVAEGIAAALGSP